MEYILYFTIGLVPSVIIAVALYFIMNKQNERGLETARLQLHIERQKFFLEPRLEAYQRIILLLERISPSNLVMRLHTSNRGAHLFHQELLNNIRQEFDHNIAQQAFISSNVWKMVKDGKEESIKIINMAAQQLDSEATSLDLSAKILEIVAEIKEQPSEIAINAVKSEFHKLF